ncbi:MAG: hypothetical protein KatS3mg097_253 [Candidatus Parcubacteria bacterium]|nr:MAG: hypothetical protein KatS3mg097_253 [Candidatus Parcubacteria bacterium]
MKSCYLCHKGKKKVAKRKKLRGKYNPVNYYFQKPNLQVLTLANDKKILVCKDCRKLVLRQKIVL